MRAGYDEPFNDAWSSKPTQAWLAKSPGRSRGLSGSEHRGATGQGREPAGWDPERILASKTLAALVLASVMGGLLLVSGRGIQALLWGDRIRGAGLLPPRPDAHEQGAEPI